MSLTDTAKWPATLHEILSLHRDTLIKNGIDQARADDIALSLTREYARVFGGIQVYIPRGQQLDRVLRDRQIYKEYRRGGAADLARKYGLSEPHIYDIYKEQRTLHAQQLQPSLL